MKDITIKIFLLSVTGLFFLMGISIGSNQQIKKQRQTAILVDDKQYYIDILDKPIVAETEEVTVHLLGTTADGIQFLVDNRGSSKLNDITIDNLIMDGRLTASYTNIEGIRAGTKTYTTVTFYEPYYPAKETTHLSGNLLIRGANSYITGKMSLIVDCE